MLHQFASCCLNHVAILQEIWKQFIRPTQPIKKVIYWADGKLLRWILNQSDDSKDTDTDELGLAQLAAVSSGLLILMQDVDSYWLRKQYEKMMERTESWVVLNCQKLLK